MEAVRRLIAECKAECQSQFVSVPRTRRGRVFVGRSGSKDYVVFHMDELCQFADSELSHLVFTVGAELLLRQTVGAAMGGFTSPSVRIERTEL